MFNAICDLNVKKIFDPEDYAATIVITILS